MRPSATQRPPEKRTENFSNCARVRGSAAQCAAQRYTARDALKTATPGPDDNRAEQIVRLAVDADQLDLRLTDQQVEGIEEDIDCAEPDAADRQFLRAAPPDRPAQQRAVTPMSLSPRG